MQSKTIFVKSAQETEKIAELIGSKLKGGECIELISDLGGGKTTFTRGLVRGMGIYDLVSSPTFTIGKQYSNNNLTCYHYDFYRLQEPGLVAEELGESVSDPKGVIVIEWADSVTHVLPTKRIIIEIYKASENSDHRKIVMKLPDEYLNLISFESIT
jgi:tRNA threonylcarbamoyladenosine biosynthesis protein TsaE